MNKLEYIESSEIIDSTSTEPFYLHEDSFKLYNPEFLHIDPGLDLAVRLWVIGGRSQREAARDCKVSPQVLSNFLRSDEGKRFVQELRALVQDELINLQNVAFRQLRLDMGSSEPQVRLKAIDTFLKYTKNQQIDVQHSFEDLVQKVKADFAKNTQG